MFRIGYRTIKTAVGASIAIGIAQLLQLDFYASAAILTILCISVTKKSSLKVSWQRFIACLIGMGFSIVLFELIGYNPVALGLLLLVFIPTMVAIKAKEGIVTSVVIILHIYTLQTVSLQIIMNEVALIIIGIGTGLVMNLYMPSVENELKKYQEETEKNFKKIFNELALFLREGTSEWDGRELTDTVILLDKAKNTALRNIENHLLRHEDQYFYYFKMREKQFEIIERIMPFISSMDETVIQGKRMAEFLEGLSAGISPTNRSHIFLGQLAEMKQEFQGMELPKDRQEFEIRSSLFYIMHELEQYLLIKDALSKS
ncbi:aromatic acid exporter family protein [Bacillus sp. FJAT-45350]|uniref:aromatic acid exporter family protein n=1 Tax=Bacillus sp. FJAT-45350 TaxID=2011014 RepID=UPI000BB882B3|nr:aromatic acid exporter family protein [Bacillus sp. FJAT-45350]